MATIPKKRRRISRQVRFTIRQVDLMDKAGVFGPDDRVELILGRLYWKMPTNPPHIYAAAGLREWLIDHVPRQDWTVFVADTPIEIPSPLRRDGLPLPDAFIARGPRSQYSGRRPGHRDAMVIVEVSDTTLDDDQSIKLTQYALAQIPEYWIINLVDRRVEVYTQPTGPDRSPTYRRRDDYGPGTSVPLSLDGRAIAVLPVDNLLPPTSGGTTPAAAP
jgi:Uma2 family endonuclease